MNVVLANCPNLSRYRAELPLGLKAFDVPHFATGERYILLDTDLLFYASPARILRWVDTGEDGCWFNQDATEPTAMSSEHAKNHYNVDLWPQVNSGLCLINRNAIDFAKMETWIADPVMKAAIQWRVEQTLHALAASDSGRGGTLSPEYEITLGGKRRKSSHCRHYVGIVRDLFYSEGIRELRPILLG